MKTYIASVKYEGKHEIIKAEYQNKKEFKKDLRANGYQVRFISTKENFDIDCEKYSEKLKTKGIMKKQAHEYEKVQAAKHGISVNSYLAAKREYFRPGHSLPLSYFIDIFKR